MASKDHKLKRELADWLNLSPQDIHFEYHQLALATIFVPGEKVERLLRLNQIGQLESLQPTLQAARFNFAEADSERYIQVILAGVLRPETSLSTVEVDQFKQTLATLIQIDPEAVCLVTWQDRLITFSLVLPQPTAEALFEQAKAGKLKDFGFQALKPLHAEGEQVEILCHLAPSRLKRAREIIAYSNSTLVEIIFSKLETAIGLPLSKESVLWQSDRVTFTLVLPSRAADILFHRYRSGKLKQIAGFEVQDLQLGRYDWDYYLGRVRVLG